MRSLARARRSDDGSLAFALLVALVGTAVVALLGPIVITQIQGTRVSIRRQQALHAAEAGLEVAVGTIQAATDKWGNGVRNALPTCGVSLTGSVDPRNRYTVTIDYFSTDPLGESDSWLQDHRMCGQGTPPSTPAYALFRSVGFSQVAGGSRGLRATYTFRTTNLPTAGGLIQVRRDAASPTLLCLAATSATPAANTPLLTQICAAGSASQTFAYSDQLQLILVSSQDPSGQGGMCVNADTNQHENEPIVLKPCASPATPGQQWYLNNTRNFQGTNDGQTLNDLCITLQSPGTAGSLMALHESGCNPAPNVHSSTFGPDSTVGTGRAGPAQHQLVNYQQFGRCMDVPASKASNNPPYVAVYPCKQAPNISDILWNQVWTWTVDQTGPITVTSPGSEAWYPAGVYCLTSPGTTADYTYVDVSPCNPNDPLPLTQQWTIVGNTGNYATSYIIKDRSGHCLSPTDPNAPSPDFHDVGMAVSKVKVAVCDGSELQKWNAPPNIVTGPTLKDISES